MSDYTAIADIGNTLIELLRNKMKDHIPKKEEIALVSPGDIKTDDNIHISLFLYQITENVHLKNQEMQKIDSTKLRYPPLSLDMYYMLTVNYPNLAVGERATFEHKMLGMAMQIFNYNAVLKSPDLPESLAENGEELHIILNPTNLDDLTKIWNTFPGIPFRPSVCYLVTPVSIDSIQPMEQVTRVGSKKLKHGVAIPMVEEE
jgi:hypothetical protein